MIAIAMFEKLFFVGHINIVNVQSAVLWVKLHP